MNRESNRCGLGATDAVVTLAVIATLVVLLLPALPAASPPEDAEIRTTTTRRMEGRDSYEVTDPCATVRITNIRLEGQPQRGIQYSPSREDVSIEFDYSVSQPGEEKTVQLIVGVGTYAETFDLVHQGKVGPAGLVGHYQGTLRIPAEVRQSVKYPGRAWFGVLLYVTMCRNKDQAVQAIRKGVYDGLQYQIATVGYR